MYDLEYMWSIRADVCMTVLINLALKFPLVGTFQTINVSNELVYLLQNVFQPAVMQYLSAGVLACAAACHH